MQNLALLRQQIRRVDLLRFRSDTYPKYQQGWVHRDIAERLELFSEAVARGESPRLILCMPPRHGKTMLASEAFPVWHLGRHPDHTIIAASYSADLASKTSKRARSLARHPVTVETFPRLRLDPERQAVQEWETTEGGGYRAAGVGGGITGMGAHILVIDDPLKDRQEAESETTRDSVWDWYTSTAYTRLMPGAGVIVILTRWHGDDLAGRLLKAADQGGDQWELVTYPAIATRDEQHRKEGDPLHPERYSLERLDAIKAAIGPYDWSALYQQEPTTREAYPFQRLQTHTRTHHGLRIHCDIDVAYTKKKTSDYTATVIGGTDSDNNWFELYSHEARMNAEERLNHIFALWELWKPRGLKSIGIEANADFLEYTLPQAMKRRGVFFTVTPLEPKGVPKADRIYELVAYMPFSFFLPNSQLAKRLTEWSPSSGTPDDLPDAFSYQRRRATAAEEKDLRPPRPDPHDRAMNDLYDTLYGVPTVKPPELKAF